MAKELPFFKFEPNQWENGNIQICSREEKGLFIDLCCMYWSRLGDVPLKLAINKLCAGNATAFDSLIRENIFTVIDGLICIDFLNEQLDEFDNTSKVNSKNAKDGWIKRRLAKEESERNATASIPQCENDAIREEKKREENTPKGEGINFEILLKTINDTFGRQFEVITEPVKKKYKAVLKQGYKKINILTAIETCKKDKYHIETGYKYCTLEYFSRSKTLDLYGTVPTEIKTAPRLTMITIADHD